jgi:hypothetical protein
MPGGGVASAGGRHPGWSCDHMLHGALVVAFAVERSPAAVAPVVASVAATDGRPVASMVALVVAATGRLPMVAPLAPVAREVAQATNHAGGMPPRLPLRKRSVRAVRLGPERMLSIRHVPALPVLDGLLHRPVPYAATLDRGRPLAQLPRPLGPQHLDGAGVGALAPGLHV